MLVLTQKKGEKIILENKITGEKSAVTVVRIPGTGLVRLGVETPDHINIYREELAQTPVAETA